MLGLGNNLISGVYVESDTLISSYTSDFTSDNDGWAPYSIEGGSLTQTFNESIGGSSGWMKNVFPGNQTGISGLITTNLFGTDRAIGDYAILSYKIYFVDDSGKWTGGDTDVTHVFYIMNKTNTFVADMDEVVSTGNYKTEAATSGTYSRGPLLRFEDSGDYPLAGAIFYIKDISINVYRPLS
jgi:hypothetical protein